MEKARYPTREEWIGKIRAAATLDEVVDLGSEGLGAMREHWGDSFEAARTARRLWLSASFLAGVPEEGLRNKDGKILLDRDRAKDAGILAAKDFAIGLMAPLEKSEDLWLAVFGARRMAEKSFADAVRGGATFGAFDPECADFAIGAWARSQSYFLKEVEIASRDWDDWEDLRSRPNGGLARRSAAPSPAEPSEREEDVLAEALRRAEPLEDADAMAQKFGFRCVRMGGRGSEISRKSAAALEEAFGALAKRAGIPEEAIGLGGLELSAGLDLGSCDAHCLPASKSLAFGAAGFVAHEWTHALEHFAESGEFPEIRSALRNLREEIGSLRQDEIPARELLGKLKAEAAGALWASESRLAHLAKSIGDERLVAWAIDPGSDARVAPRASEPLKAAWLEAISDGKDERGLRIPREREEAIAMARDIFEKGSGAEKPHPDPAVNKKC